MLALRRCKRGGFSAVAPRAALATALSGSALLLAVSLATGEIGFAKWFALLPLFAAVRWCGALEAASWGSYWGAILYIISAALPASPILAGVLNCLLLVSLPGLFAGGLTLLAARFGFSPLFMGLAWAGVEFALRPVGLEMGLLAGDGESSFFARSLAQILGYLLVAFLIAYVNAAVFSFLCVAARVELSFAGPHPATCHSPTPVPPLGPVISPHLSPISRPRAPPALSFGCGAC